MEQHLSQYRIFYEVARCGNISRAAKELYISQPAISKAIGFFSEIPGASSSPPRETCSSSMWPPPLIP